MGLHLMGSYYMGQKDEQGKVTAEDGMETGDAAH